MKLFDKHPSDLPADLRQQLTGWLQAAPAAIEGFIRPGCVFLTAQMLLPEEGALAALAQGMGQLLRMVLSDDAHACWREGTMLLQVRGRGCSRLRWLPAGCLLGCAGWLCWLPAGLERGLDR